MFDSSGKPKGNRVKTQNPSQLPLYPHLGPGIRTRDGDLFSRFDRSPESILPTPMLDSATYFQRRGIVFHDMPLPPVMHVVSEESFDASVSVGRFLSEEFSSLSQYLVEVLKECFKNVTKCSIYRAENGNGLGHYLTISGINHFDDTVKIASLKPQLGIRDESNPIFEALITKKPIIISHTEGINIVVQDLDRKNKAADVYPVRDAEDKAGAGDTAIIPMYYQDREKPYGVLVLEGDLRCKDSPETGYYSVRHSGQILINLAAQLSFISTHKYDPLTSLLKKKDFELDLRTTVRRILDEPGQGDHAASVIESAQLDLLGIIGRQTKVDNEKLQEDDTYFILIDLDHFKEINDKYHHLAGDALLSAIARSIRKCVRGEEHSRDPDLLARWGGEEFAVRMNGLSKKNALLIAERIRTAIGGKEEIGGARVGGTKVVYQGHELSVTCSIGLLNVSRFVRSSENRDPDSLATEVFNECDGRLFTAKQQGRDRVVFFDDNRQ